VLASRYIEEPHLILRKALIRGDRLSTMAHDLGVFIGRTLFFTSNLHLTGPEKREKVDILVHMVSERYMTSSFPQMTSLP
jgi:5-methylthioribose kinase